MTDLTIERLEALAKLRDGRPLHKASATEAVWLRDAIAEIARLTAERDEARADYLRRHNDAADRFEEIVVLRAERDELAAKLAGLREPTQEAVDRAVDAVAMVAKMREMRLGCDNAPPCSMPPCTCAEKLVAFLRRPSAPSEAQVEAVARALLKTREARMMHFHGKNVTAHEWEEVPQWHSELRDEARAVLSAIGQGENERADALYDSAYIAGMKAGYNFGVAEDQEGLAAAIKARDGYLAPLARHASRQAGKR